MLIQNQNVNSIVQAQQPDVRLANNGGSVAVANASNSDVAPGPAVQLPPNANDAIAQQLTSQKLQTVVNGINQTMGQMNQSLQFSLEPNSETPIVRVVDTETGQVILQIPSKVAMAIAQSIDQYQHGLLLKQKA
jgi:flagellar protein FlaG